MIELYTSYTSNAQRASIAVLESGLDHIIRPIDIYKGETRSPSYLSINRNGTLPALVDHDGPDGASLTLTQSVNIVWYLAEKSGCLLPSDDRSRALAQDWSLFMATDVYPPFASQYYLRWARLPDPEPAAATFHALMVERFSRLDRHLEDSLFVAGDDFTVADVIAYPMSAMAAHDFPAVAALEHVKRWRETVSVRPAVAEAMSWFVETAPTLDSAPSVWLDNETGPSSE